MQTIKIKIKNKIMWGNLLFVKHPIEVLVSRNVGAEWWTVEKAKSGVGKVGWKFEGHAKGV